MLYESLGLEHFAIALQETDKLTQVDLSSNQIGPSNFSLLQKIFKTNINIELLNLDECRIDGQ